MRHLTYFFCFRRVHVWHHTHLRCSYVSFRGSQQFNEFDVHVM